MPSTAGRPAANSLRRSRTSSAAVMRASTVTSRPAWSPLLPIAVGLVPVLDPGRVQRHVLGEVRQPDLDHLGIEARRIDRRLLERGEIALILDNEGMALMGLAQVMEEIRSVRVICRCWHVIGIGL